MSLLSCLKTCCSILCNQINLTLCLVMGRQRLCPDILASNYKWVWFILSHALAICLLEDIFVHDILYPFCAQLSKWVCKSHYYDSEVWVPGTDMAWMCATMYCHIYIFKYIYIGRLVCKKNAEIKYVNIYMCISLCDRGAEVPWCIEGRTIYWELWPGYHSWSWLHSIFFSCTHPSCVSPLCTV